MLLIHDENYIEIKVIGYEYPVIERKNDTGFDYDLNWLMLYVNKRVDDKRVKGIFPCFLTTDIKRFLKLLIDFQSGKVSSLGFGGIEPNFCVEIEQGILSVFFYGEDGKEEFPDVKKFVKPVTDHDIQAFISFCKDSMANYPLR